MPSAFPDTTAIGALYLKYFKVPLDWDAVSFSTKYEDGGVDWNISTDTPPQRWELEYGGLTEAQAKVLDDHYASAQGQVLGFSFTEPREYPHDYTTGGTFTDVHYESYKHTRPENKYWLHSIAIVLVKRV